jgi:hypothetical protein
MSRPTLKSFSHQITSVSGADNGRFLSFRRVRICQIEAYDAESKVILICLEETAVLDPISCRFIAAILVMDSPAVHAFRSR